jgi:6-phosphogluconolactonase (cycloisomerase 2 family)
MYYKIIITVLTTVLVSSCTGKKSQQLNKTVSVEETTSFLAKAAEGDLFLLVGTYTSEEGSKGIYVYRFNSLSGKSDSVSMVELTNPSYLTLSPDEKFVYAVGENEKESSAVYALSFNKKHGQLSIIDTRLTLAESPCYITIHSNGKDLHTANYGGGSITSFQVDSEGLLGSATWVTQFNGNGPDSVRQQGSHVHSVRYSPDGLYLFATDLGTDKMYRFTVQNTPFDGQPVIQQSSKREFIMPPGTGPRHFDFHPNGGKYLYVLGELSGQVILFDYNGGDLKQKQVVAADTLGAQGSADIHVSPDGRFLYASNRLKGDGLAIFSIDPNDGTLTKLGYQLTVKHPRNFVITPDGNYVLVAGRDDNLIQVFALDKETGLLKDTDHSISLSKPVCLKFASME